MKLVATASQTIGPFFKHGLALGPAAALQAGKAGVIEIHGRLFDAQQSPVSDAVIEIWQCGADGNFAGVPEAGSPFSPGFSRLYTGPAGEFAFTTVRPGALPGSRSAPYLAVVIFARGLLRHLYTRIYFDGEEANGGDPVMQSVPADRRSTLLARKEGPARYAFDLHLGGPGETVFFSY